MFLPMRKFKAHLVALPKFKPEKDGADPKSIGSFTVGKKYRIYSIFSTLEFTDFLVSDDKGFFHWINMSFFKK